MTRDDHEPRPQLLGIRNGAGEVLGSGFFNEVRALRDDLVIKVAKPFGPFAQPLSWLIRARREHELIAPYLNTPSTYYLRVHDSDGRPVSVILQRRLEGEVFSQLSEERITAAGMRSELERLQSGLQLCVRELGWLADVIGGPPRWGVHDLRYSNNLLVDREGKIWLIDPGAFFFWFATSNPLGRFYTWLLLRSARRLVRKARIRERRRR